VLRMLTDITQYAFTTDHLAIRTHFSN
jgi:hypothetical protein